MKPAIFRTGLLRPSWAVFVVWLGLAGIAFHALTAGFFGKRLGLDYDYFMPWLLSGFYWYLHNGLAIPWFTPALCAGIPHFPNPQSMYYALPQLLAFVVDPLTSVRITVWLFAFFGFAGMWLLASLYTRSPAILAFASLAFAFNDMYLWRMYVGHLTFQPFMLLPLVCYLLLKEQGAMKGWLDAILAGGLLAYFIHAGAGVLVVPAGACLIVVLLALGKDAGVWRRLAAALATALVLSAVKLVAAGYFMAQFPRSLYALPGTDGILGSIELTLRALVWPPDQHAINRLVVHHAFQIEPVELNYAIGIVPIFVMALCGMQLAAWRGSPKPTWKWLPIGLILCMPIFLDVYQPMWDHILKALPYFGNVSSLFRWNMIYLIPAILLCVRMLDALPGAATGIAPIAALAIIPGALTYLPSYLQEYNPARIDSAWHAARQGGGVPAVRQLDEALVDGKRASTVGSDDVLTEGASQIVCNEPLFGYRLENFRFDAVFKGPVFGRRDGGFNFYLPQCFLFPKQNRCEKGDRFPVAQKTQLMRLTDYRSIEFGMPVTQRIAIWVSYIGLIALLGVAGARLWLFVGDD